LEGKKVFGKKVGRYAMYHPVKIGLASEPPRHHCLFSGQVKKFGKVMTSGHPARMIILYDQASLGSKAVTYTNP